MAGIQLPGGFLPGAYLAVFGGSAQDNKLQAIVQLTVAREPRAESMVEVGRHHEHQEEGLTDVEIIATRLEVCQGTERG